MSLLSNPIIIDDPFEPSQADRYLPFPQPASSPNEPVGMVCRKAAIEGHCWIVPKDSQRQRGV